MRQYLIPVFIAFVSSAILTSILIALQHLFIAPHKTKKIQREGSFHTATAEQMNRPTVMDSAGQDRAWFTWEVNGKKYKGFFCAPPWSPTVRTVYFVKNPATAVDNLNEIGQFRRRWLLFFLLLGFSILIIVLVKK